MLLKILNIPKDVRIVDLMTIGYSKDKSINMGRKSIAEIIFYDKYE